MNHSSTRRASIAHAGIPRKHPLALACATVFFAMGVAQASAADEAADAAGTQANAPTAAKPDPDNDKTLGTITVTGIRGSIESSLSKKMNSNEIIEAISAEDIGQLPDISIGESLKRLPGLAAQRVDGRAQVIAIRGLSPDFAATLLNGREQVSTGDNRGVEFDQYPSELINSVEVYKTPNAMLVGQGLSGTIDMHVVRPLDFRDRQAAFNLRGESNSLGKQNANADKYGSRFSASYIDQFADRTFGVALGFAHLDSPFHEQHYKAWWWGSPYAQAEGQPKDSTTLEGSESWARTKDQKRDGLMSVLQWRPNDNFESTLDLYYSKFDEKETMRGLMWPQDPWTGTDTTHPTYTNVGLTQAAGQTFLTSGTINNVPVVARNDYNTRKDKLLSVGWKNRVEFDNHWALTGDLSYSDAKRREQTFETYAGAGKLSSIDFAIPLRPGFPSYHSAIDYGDPNAMGLSDPAGWGRSGRMERHHQTDSIKAARLEASHPLGWIFTGVNFGVDFSEREKKKEGQVYYACLAPGVPDAGGTCTNDKTAFQKIDPGLLLSSTSLGFSGLGNVLSYDPMQILSRYYTLTRFMSKDDYRKTFSIDEKVSTAYAKFDIDTAWGAIPIRGNAGAQLVHTDQSSTGGSVSDSGVVGTQTIGTTYNDFLPSLNLTAEVAERTLVRFGLGKQLARGRIDDMRAASEASVCLNASTGCIAGHWSGNGGNPKLKPWRAKALDLSLEKYFGDASYIALAVFGKKLDSYIYKKDIQNYDFSGYVNTTPITPVSNLGVFTAPDNGTGGSMAGWELSTALEGKLLADWLDGFGMQGSFSYTNSSVPAISGVTPGGGATSGGAPTNLPGLSKKVSSLIVYYEKNGFSARLGQTYRSDFIGEITTLFAQRSYTRVLADKTIDAQLGYEFKEGSFKGLSVLLQINNLTNSPYRTAQDTNFDGGAVAPQEYNLYGRQVLLGLNYKL